MKATILNIFFLLSVFFGLAQSEFHVFPMQHKTTPGSTHGDGSLENPWDLQTALNQKPDKVSSGDTIWMHEGIYNGRYMSRLKGETPNQYITVSAYKEDKVVLNGNVPSKQDGVLIVKGDRVLFKNFEITFLGDFSRDESEADFQVCAAIMHLSGVNCMFYNLNIHDNPGLGIGSWRHTAGSTIEACRIYNNGFLSKDGKGRGEGIYVQNMSDEIRLIKDNIIFNNYYKGVEVWSAGKHTSFEYVKNITLDHNIIFNSGTPSGKHVDNVIVASNDRNGINIAKNIRLSNNVLWHNTGDANGSILGDAPALTLGFHKNAPIENVTVHQNIIVGGYNGLRLLYAKSLNFTNNEIYTGNVQIDPSMQSYYTNWNFNSNRIYTKLKKPFRVTRTKDYNLDMWRETFNLDAKSEVLPLTQFELDKMLHLSQQSQNKKLFSVALFNAEGEATTVNFSDYQLKKGTHYQIYDVENPETILKSGMLSEAKEVQFPMQSAAFQKPLHNTSAKKNLSNFGVFRIVFETEAEIEADIEADIKRKRTDFERFLEWLGF
ncbi:hypothetical protein ESY86_01660 [Subsaximicrobium wynnwilliamsii]|uniref:Right-handed parallel beta-helix repeat-containing protein n=1 Tax=Subsaximicrobium wynnwilliamsii TaxID=291179 RepID=A0A5C6ZMM1_9FLAO|nr:right-handed parallel beta-helix repeat-containing protein [Subsaximicrobium wynnwilliamsii]TXD85274.1 hypothetical protein ESY87_02830 [Subsaximicrobium wynnwilliamsii]TXD91316.1 hypothetical protein ESY86_01660 [Subsaximicrobium wynnwilliamsii]TXE04710.1 hypothetical protein ESY88_04310 [Subsaximicrobium wynnwilliamsii]